MPKQYQLHVLVDGSLREAITQTARAEGLSVSDLIRSTLRSTCDRRTRVASALGLHQFATDAEITAELQQALGALSDADQANARKFGDAGQAIEFAAMRASRARKPDAASSKPSPAPAVKPAKRSGPKRSARDLPSKADQARAHSLLDAQRERMRDAGVLDAHARTNSQTPEQRGIFVGGARPIGAKG